METKTKNRNQIREGKKTNKRQKTRKPNCKKNTSTKTQKTKQYKK